MKLGIWARALETHYAAVLEMAEHQIRSMMGRASHPRTKEVQLLHRRPAYLDSKYSKKEPVWTQGIANRIEELAKQTTMNKKPSLRSNMETPKRTGEEYTSDLPSRPEGKIP